MKNYVQYIDANYSLQVKEYSFIDGFYVLEDVPTDFFIVAVYFNCKRVDGIEFHGQNNLFCQAFLNDVTTNDLNIVQQNHFFNAHTSVSFKINSSVGSSSSNSPVLSNSSSLHLNRGTIDNLDSLDVIGLKIYSDSDLPHIYVREFRNVQQGTDVVREYDGETRLLKQTEYCTPSSHPFIFGEFKGLIYRLPFMYHNGYVDMVVPTYYGLFIDTKKMIYDFLPFPDGNFDGNYRQEFIKYDHSLKLCIWEIENHGEGVYDALPVHIGYFDRNIDF